MSDQQTYKTLLRATPGPETKFAFVDPPFNFNDPNVTTYTPEVTGNFLLKSLCHRLGWPSLSGKRLLDFGCGVRFTRAIINLGIDIGLYAGVETNPAPVAWLKANVHDSRFRFEHLNAKNAMYNPNGDDLAVNTLEKTGFANFDAASMFSVITHQDPTEAEKTFKMLHRCVAADGALYFTAFLDEQIDGYGEGNPAQPDLLSTYLPATLLKLVERSGWQVTDIYPPSVFQQYALVCRKR